MAHAIERTSPYGEKFIGQCIKCGAQGLGMGDALVPCPQDNDMSDAAALVKIIKKGDK